MFIWSSADWKCSYYLSTEAIKNSKKCHISNTHLHVFPFAWILVWWFPCSYKVYANQNLFYASVFVQIKRSKRKKKKKDSNFTQNVRVYILSLHIFTLFSLEIILLLWHFCWWLLHLKVLLKHLSLILAAYTLSITFLSAVNSMQLLQSSNWYQQERINYRKKNMQAEAYGGFWMILVRVC